MFLGNWAQILKILITGSLAYISIIIILRLSGKRTLSQMNAFDFIITIALGSRLATAMLSKDTPLLKGLTGLALLVLLPFLVSWTYVRLPLFGKLVKSEPRLLFYDGEFKNRTLKEERIKKGELLQAAQCQGILSWDQITAIVLETNGRFSIIKNASQLTHSTLQNVKRE